MQEQASVSRAKALPLMLIVTGIVLMTGSAVLAGRLIWEMTFLTWRLGPQMIGFSLAHGVGVLLFLFPLALFVWLLVSFCRVVVWKLKRERVPNGSWIALGSAVLILGLLSIPQSFWTTVFASEMASSPHAAELLVNAAGYGDSMVVHGLLKRGVQVNATDREGNTALHSAAGAGRPDLVSYLITQGADINAVNLYGDSALERAIANRQATVEKILTLHGAKNLRGDAEQRHRASERIVRRAIEEQNAHGR